MFVIDISHYIMDIQTVQINMVDRSLILSHCRHSGAVHHINGIVGSINYRSPVDNLQIIDFNVFRIIQQNGR